MTVYCPPSPALETERPRLGEALVSLGLITEDDLERALARQATGPRARLGAVLQDMGLVTDADVAEALAAVHGLPLVDIDFLHVHGDIARLVPRETAQRLGVLVYAKRKGRLHVVAADPVDVVALDDIRMITGATSLSVSIATRSSIVSALAQVWAEQDDEDALRAFVDETTVDAVLAIDDGADDPATIRLVDRLLALAVRERASDLHIEPHRSGVLVRLRVDGVLREVLELPKSGHSALTARMKIVAELNVIERRVPQDGRARIRIPGGTVDARISTLPSMHGEKLVIRLLPSAARLPDLLGLGVSEEQKKVLLDVLSQPQGLVLITGPTGSGKTNTLYAALNDGVDRTRNVITLEDPVEIELPGATQVQIDERVGLDFARGLRASLRQDPDVILVGEVRDHETADLAVRAALTGHLVMSTLHTMDAASAMTRLTDMGVPAYLITSSLALVVSQRLVRVPCGSCSIPDAEAPAVLAELGVTDREGDWTRAVGCPACADTGYLGRTAVLEMLPVSATVRGALLSGASEDEVRRAGRRDGFASLLAAGIETARAGRTTLAEVLRAVPRELLTGTVE